MNTLPIGRPWEASLYVYAIVPAQPGSNDADLASGGLRTIAAGPFAAVAGDGPKVES